jgi:hypothetical protein
MGGLRTDAETQSPAGRVASAWPGGQNRETGARSRWAVLAAYLAAAVVLFTAYLRLSETYQLNSDSANILLMASDLLHGHLLLHGWYMSDVSFYPTELPQYALLVGLLGLHMQTAHVGAAMTYTLTFLLAVLLARSGSSGRAALIRTLIAAGIMLAPEFGYGVFALDMSVGHIGTSVPLLLVWLLLDKAPRRWYVPVLTAVLLAWVLVADPIVYVVGVGPLGFVAAMRVIRGFRDGSGRWTTRLAAQRDDLALGAAAVAAAVLAWIVNNVLSALGGFTVNRLPFYLTPWADLHNNLPALWKVLQIFGADPIQLSGFWLALAIVHFASLLVVGWALGRVARHFYAASLTDQVLAAGIVLNIVLYLLTNASDEAAHEVAVIVPFAAALAARMLIRPTRAARADVAGNADAVRGSAVARRRVAVPVWTAGILVLAGYTAGLGWELTQPTQPPANTHLAAWLEDHHLSYGLSGYWTSSSVTVDSGQQVKVRALMQYTLQSDLWMSDSGWYNPKQHYANFVVLDSKPGNFSHWEPVLLVKKYFGTPARTYHTGPYTILVWHKNLLKDIPRRTVTPVAPSQLSLDRLKPGPGQLGPVQT